VKFVYVFVRKNKCYASVPVERVPFEFAEELFKMVIGVLERCVAAKYLADIC
jgi:hypothetical protein